MITIIVLFITMIRSTMIGTINHSQYFYLCMYCMVFSTVDRVDHREDVGTLDVSVFALPSGTLERRLDIEAKGAVRPSRSIGRPGGPMAGLDGTKMDVK